MIWLADLFVDMCAAVAGAGVPCAHIWLLPQDMSATQPLAQPLTEPQGTVAAAHPARQLGNFDTSLELSQTPLAMLAYVCARESDAQAQHVHPIMAWSMTEYVRARA